LWTHFRRLVASIMLVAVTSFVIHGGAMAGLHQHRSGSTECATSASSGHVHWAGTDSHDERAAHVHEDGSAHQHAHAGSSHADVTADGATGNGQASTPDTCCASVCAVALTTVAQDGLSAPLSVTAELLPDRQDGVSTHLDGLKRPPRTPSIA
jgi:hypothetical protein